MSAQPRKRKCALPQQALEHGNTADRYQKLVVINPRSIYTCTVVYIGRLENNKGIRRYIPSAGKRFEREEADQDQVASIRIMV
jgi:hypothetical protein